MNQTIIYNGAVQEKLYSEAYTQEQTDTRYGSNVKESFRSATITIDKIDGE